MGSGSGSELVWTTEPAISISKNCKNIEQGRKLIDTCYKRSRHLPELVRWTKLLRVLWASKEDELEAVMGGETVAIGISLSASLNQVMADAGLRPPLVSRAQLLKFVLDMFNQRRDKRWDEKSHRTVGPPLYAMRPEMPTWTP